MSVRHPYRRGDVVLVQFPFSGPTGTKARPAIVVSTDIYHEEWDEVLVLAVTSRQPRNMRATDCSLRDWKLEGLSQPSWIRSHVATIQRTLILKTLGQFTQRDLAGAEDSLRIALGL